MMNAYSVWTLFRVESFRLPEQYQSSEARLAELVPVGAAQVATLLRDVLETAACPLPDQTWLVDTGSIEKANTALSVLRQGISVCVGGLRVVLEADVCAAASTFSGMPSESDIRSIESMLHCPDRLESPVAHGSCSSEGGFPDFAKEQSIERAIRTALQKGGFFIEAQPVVDLKTGRIAYAECLLRLKGCRYGPDDFIPVAEKTGLIHAIGEQALALAASLLSQADEQGVKAHLSINISPLQLRSGSISATLNTLCQSVAPQGGAHISNGRIVAEKRLELEVTEGTALTSMDLAVIRQLESEGFVVAMDDFGGGYSSVRQLLMATSGKVKIDHEVLSLLTSNNRLDRLGPLVEIAKSKGGVVVVEGIESMEQLMAARNAGAELGQGFFIYRPMSPQALIDLLITTAQASGRESETLTA